MAVTFYQSGFSLFSLWSYRNRRRRLHLLAAQTTKSWKAAKQDYLHGAGTLSMHYPNMCPSGAAGSSNVLCWALLVQSNTDRTAVLIANVFSCHVNHWPTAQFHWTEEEEEGFLGQNVGLIDSYSTRYHGDRKVGEECTKHFWIFRDNHSISPIPVCTFRLKIQDKFSFKPDLNSEDNGH